MIKFPLVIIIFFLVLNTRNNYLFSQKFIPQIHSACGYASIKSPALMKNPAQLNKVNGTNLDFFHSPSKFGLKELSSAFASFSYRFENNSVASASINGLGNNLYNEYSSAIKFAQVFENIITIGVTIEYSRIHIKNYNSDYQLYANIGAIIFLTEYISAGFLITNINGDYYKTADGYQTDRKAIIGIGITPLERLSFDIDAVVDINKNSGISFSGKYELEEIALIRAAILSYPLTFEGGILIHILSNSDIMIELNHHEKLGLSTTFGISFFW